jgi:hypothetical protein
MEGDVEPHIGALWERFKSEGSCKTPGEINICCAYEHNGRLHLAYAQSF